MSCAPGQPCEEGLKRRRALAALGLMAAIFLGLSAASFVDSRGQVVPTEVHYGDQDAVAGKRVFQAYNCMGCHTIVGNGAYFGPDLTKTYNAVGPAWLEAFLPSAGAWPAGGAVRLQLQNAAVAEDAGTDDLDSYLEKYPGAAERVSRRGGQSTHMPNLPLTRAEVGQLIAFLKYTSEMDTEGWPPKPKVNGLEFAKESRLQGASPVAAATATAAAATVAESPVARGAELVADNGCTACHSTGTDQLVGPGWGGLYGSDVRIAGGSTVVADEAYLTEKIEQPDAKVVAGFEAGVMPSYADMLDADQVSDIVAFLKSLGGK